MGAPKLADVLPLRKIDTREDAMQWGKEWVSHAQHLEEYSLTLEYLVDAYKLQLRVAEREIERLRGERNAIV